MNREWLRQRLESFKTLNETYDRAYRQNRYESSPEINALNSQINADVPAIRKIVEALNPDLVEDITEPMHMTGTSKTRSAVEKALGILRDEDDLRTNLAPDAPSLVADQFHPAVWNAASAIWETGMYRVAVQQAAVSLSAHIAAKAGSSLTERALVSQVFSKDEPRPGQVRLHLSGGKATETWRSRQDGLHLIAQGAFAGIRNVATHTNDEWTEQVALEHLAVLSVVARWTDETVPVRGQ